MLFLMLVVIGAKNLQIHAVILISIFILMIGPFKFFTKKHELSYILTDFAMAFKMLTPFIVFSFCKIVSEVFPRLFNHYVFYALKLNFLAIVVNLMLGIFGYGYKSYAIGEDGVGINGFYVAGNELGGAIVVLFGFMLHYFWVYRKNYYYFFAAFTLFCGLIVSTKSAILSVLLLCLAIPLFNERQGIFKITTLKLRVVVVASLLICLLIC